MPGPLIAERDLARAVERRDSHVQGTGVVHGVRTIHYDVLEHQAEQVSVGENRRVRTTDLHLQAGQQPDCS